LRIGGVSSSTVINHKCSIEELTLFLFFFLSDGKNNFEKIKNMIDLRNGDCIELLKTIPSNSVDLVLCDIPYGTTACKWDTIIPFYLMWEQLKRVRKDNTAILLFGSEPFSSSLRMSNISEYKYDWIWDKKRVSNPMLAKKMPLKNYEIISVFYKQQPIYNPQPTQKSTGKGMSNKGHNETHETETTGKSKLITKRDYTDVGYPKMLLTEIKVINNLTNDRAGLHPTQKPIELNEYLIKTYTDEGMTVLDFTMGAGACAVACVNLDRNFIGFELDEKYFNIAFERVEKKRKEKDLTQKALFGDGM
jgi:site-specific DNA-methyltransferase (adenine-specific)